MRIKFQAFLASVSVLATQTVEATKMSALEYEHFGVEEELSQINADSNLEALSPDDQLAQLS